MASAGTGGQQLMGASPALISAVEALWRVPRPGPNNLLAASAFTAVSDVCRADYGGDKPVFALSTAIRSLGVPCWLLTALPPGSPRS